MDCQSQLELIKNFNPDTITHYMKGNLSECFFAVIMKNGLINTTKFPRGRIYTEDLEPGEHVLCFKHSYNRNTREVILYLREQLFSFATEADKIMYEYILANSKLIEQ